MGERQKVGGQAALRSGSFVCGCDLNFGYQRRNRVEYSRVLLSRDLEGVVGGKRRRERSQKRAIRRIRERDNFHGLSIGVVPYHPPLLGELPFAGSPSSG
jgi:hypothetical protein